MTTPPDDLGIDAELLGRFLAGECTGEEASIVRERLASRPAAARALSRFLEGLDAEPGRPQAPEVGASWASLRTRMHAERGADEPRPVRPRSRTPERLRAVAGARHAPRWRSAAAVAAVAAAGISGWLLLDRGRPADAPPPPPRLYETAAAQRAELLLSDGSRVRIAPASRLRVAADYGEAQRELWLEGEAYFDVVHDERRPFTVHVGGTTARDLGTAFAVRGYADDDAVQVVVREGAVALAGVGTLRAGDVGRLGTDGAARLLRDADVASLLGWLDGRHDFTDAPLARVLRTMHRWYGVEVTLADSALADLQFTGTLGDVPPRAAIELVAATLGLRVRREAGETRLERDPHRTPRARATHPRRARGP